MPKVSVLQIECKVIHKVLQHQCQLLDEMLRQRRGIAVLARTASQHQYLHLAFFPLLPDCRRLGFCRAAQNAGGADSRGGNRQVPNEITSVHTHASTSLLGTAHLNHRLWRRISNTSSRVSFL